MLECPSHCWHWYSWTRSLGCIRKAVEKSGRSKPVRTFLHCLWFSSCLYVPALISYCDFPYWWTVTFKPNKLFPPQLAFFLGICHCNWKTNSGIWFPNLEPFLYLILARNSWVLVLVEELTHSSALPQYQQASLQNLPCFPMCTCMVLV